METTLSKDQQKAHIFFLSVVWPSIFISKCSHSIEKKVREEFDVAPLLSSFTRQWLLWITQLINNTVKQIFISFVCFLCVGRVAWWRTLIKISFWGMFSCTHNWCAKQAWKVNDYPIFISLHASFSHWNLIRNGTVWPLLYYSTHILYIYVKLCIVLTRFCGGNYIQLNQIGRLLCYANANFIDNILSAFSHLIWQNYSLPLPLGNSTQ